MFRWWLHKSLGADSLSLSAPRASSCFGRHVGICCALPSNSDRCFFKMRMGCHGFTRASAIGRLGKNKGRLLFIGHRGAYVEDSVRPAITHSVLTRARGVAAISAISNRVVPQAPPFVAVTTMFTALHEGTTRVIISGTAAPVLPACVRCWLLSLR